MNISTDSYFKIGKSHKICQDYALHNCKRACIADGCSSATFSDFGAKMWCAKFIHSNLSDIECLDEIIECVANLGLPSESLYSTFLGIDCLDNGFLVYSSGDGYIVGVNHNNKLNITKYDYNNMPYYLAYSLYDEQLIYVEQFQKNNLQFMVNDQLKDIRTGMVGRVEFFPYEEYKMIAVLSDGANTFNLPLEEVVNKLLTIPYYQGNYIQRRCEKQLGLWAKDGFVNDDDFSIAIAYKSKI